MWRKEKSPKFERPRVGLALSGGAARGVAHIGVLKVFAEQEIPVDFVAGTSAGALVGGALAAGLTIEQLEEFGRGLRWRDFGRMSLSRLGIQSNARMEDYIRARFPVTRFEDLRLPFAAVATDLHTGTPVVLSGTGDLPFAIRASCALPGWYIPVTDEQGRQLVDGGLVANVPTAAVRALGAEVVVAVDVNSEGAKFMGPAQSIVGVLLASLILVQRTAAAHQRQLADVVIMPRVGHIRWDEMTRADELIRAGEEAARLALEPIRQLLAPPPEEPPRRWFQRRHQRDRQTA
ncbi:MAG TPA: patatin-like phospholipase family protein [Pyrinomonadaceae bacterium]|nr:patatin-like phospholipase family protein [Pyrinomonadaceae bacterium]